MLHPDYPTWQSLDVPSVVSSTWTPHAARAVLREVMRLRRRLDAAQAAFVLALKAETGRDTRATLVREFGLSDSDAHRAVRTAAVVERLAGAQAAMERGDVSGDHVAKLAEITDNEAASALLGEAASLGVDEFAKRVSRYRIESSGANLRERQRRARYLSFFNGEDGCVGIRGKLPSLEGERVKAVLMRLREERFRREHPQRAESAGANSVDSGEQRLADALVAAVLGDPDEDREQARARPDRPAVVITMDLETLESEIVSSGPIATAEVVDLIARSRADIYAYVRDMNGAVLKFGRSRRLASLAQRLALAVRYGGCSVPGCREHWMRSEVHHEPPFESGGTTDIDTLFPFCRSHHRHRHRHDEHHPGGRGQDPIRISRRAPPAGGGTRSRKRDARIARSSPRPETPVSAL